MKKVDPMMICDDCHQPTVNLWACMLCFWEVCDKCKPNHGTTHQTMREGVRVPDEKDNK